MSLWLNQTSYLRNPWSFFLLFLVSNSMLSYSYLPLSTKLLIGFLGLAIPGLIWVKWRPTSISSAGKPIFAVEWVPKLPFWMWALGIGLALFIRFYQLTRLSYWPLFDEGVYGYDALQLAREWKWSFFFGNSQAPPFYVWSLALLFKTFGASLETLWFLPAFFSTLAVPLSYLAARTFFSRSFSFFFVFLSALSFWPFFMGRFSFMTGMILPWEYLAFIFLGNLLKSPSDSLRQKKLLLGLGVVLGTGFYIHLHWPAIALVLAGTAAAWIMGRKNKSPLAVRFKLLLWLVVPMLLVVIPLLLAGLHENYGGWLSHLWVANHIAHGTSIGMNLCLYTSALFWGVSPQDFTYKPFWGGFFNPVLTSFFFIGLFEVFLNLSRRLYRWLLAAGIFWMLPGILTNDLEAFRWLPLLPILFAISVLGLSSLTSAVSKPFRWFLIFPLLWISVSLDFYHLLGPYHQSWKQTDVWWGYTKSLGRYEAFQILKKIEAEKGPGLIFQDFVQGLPDETLRVAIDDFNAAENPRLPFETASWGAVLTNINYQPFLVKRFPKGKAYRLLLAPPGPEGGWMVWVFPVTSVSRPILQNWERASQALGPFLEKSQCYIPGEPLDEIKTLLQNANPLFNGDSFLKACYGEKISDLDFKKETFSSDQAKNFSQPIQDLKTAIQDGLPAAHLYYRLGIYYQISGNLPAARRAFLAAEKAPGALTDAAQSLLSLKTRS
jgi:hypothetical protein